jgi:glycosyltransferase involved in cell wall biosynthesis
MKIVILEPNVCVMAGMVRLAFMMADVFKLLGHNVTIVGRTHKEVRARVTVATPFGPQILNVKEGLKQKHYDLKDFREYQPVKHLTANDIMLENIPLSHPFMYFPQRVKRLLYKADVVWTGSEIYVKLCEAVNGVEKKQVQYVHWPLETLKPVYGHPPKTVWANSQFTQKHVKDVWGLDATIVYPPIYCDIYQNHNGFDKREFDVVMLSRLDASKLESVLPFLKDFKVAVVGSAYGYEKELPSWVKLYKNATMKEAADVLSRSKMYLHGKGFGEYGGGKKSEKEHFGQTIIEAMASGCVPIVPEAGGPVEIVGSNEEYGYLFTSIGELRTKIRKLLEDEELWTQRSRTAVKRAEDFDVPIIAKQVEKLLEKRGEEVGSRYIV